MRVLLVVDTTQWIIAGASLSSAVVALALALGFKEWITRPRMRLVLRDPSDPERISDRVVTKRLGTGDLCAFVRVRLYNDGRSTARNVCVRVLKLHQWDPVAAAWRRARPELDGRLLQPSNQLSTEPNLVDVLPHSDRLIDLASVDCDRATSGAPPILLEISHPWRPDEANALEPGTWLLELMVCGDNVRADRSYVTVAFDGTWPGSDTADIWRHFAVHGPFAEAVQPTPELLA